MRIAVLNDLHPSEFPGAATIAYEFACEASKYNSVEFWASSLHPNSLAISPLVKERIRGISPKYDFKVSSSFPFKIISEFFSLGNMIWYFLRLLEFKPEVVWIHQIGTRFPRTIIIINKLFRIRTLVTLHDFSVVLPRKLYPNDLGIHKVDSFLEQLQNHQGELSLQVRPTEALRFRVIYRLRFFLLRAIYSFADDVVCISDLQFQILSSLKFPTSGTVANGINRCACPIQSKSKSSILFAGRPNAKGLNQVIAAVAESGWHLHLAGPERLNEIAAIKLPSSQFTFHGALSRDDLFLLIHKVQLVAVISECFDVYPTITLESLRHGTLVLTTRTTGNSNIVKLISEDLIVDYAAIPRFTDVEKLLHDFSTNFRRIESENLGLLTVEDSFNRYALNFL